MQTRRSVVLLSADQFPHLHSAPSLVQLYSTLSGWGMVMNTFWAFHWFGFICVFPQREKLLLRKKSNKCVIIWECMGNVAHISLCACQNKLQYDSRSYLKCASRSTQKASLCVCLYKCRKLKSGNWPGDACSDLNISTQKRPKQHIQTRQHCFPALDTMFYSSKKYPTFFFFVHSVLSLTGVSHQ